MQKKTEQTHSGDQIVIPIRTSEFDKNETEFIDVWEEKETGLSSDTKLLLEADIPSRFPMFLQYFLLMVFVGATLLIPAVIIRGSLGNNTVTGWFTLNIHDEYKMMIYLWSILLAFSWITGCATLFFIALVFAMFGYISKASGRFIFGSPTLSFLALLSKLRIGLSILVASMVTFEVARHTSATPYGIYRAYVSTVILGLLLIIKAILVNGIRTHYFAKYLGKKTKDNSKALKLLGKLWDFYLHDFEISATHKGIKRHENIHISNNQAAEIGRTLYLSISSHAQCDAIRPEHLNPVLKDDDAKFLVNYIDVDRNGDLIQADFEAGIRLIYEERRQLKEAFLDSDRMIGRLDKLSVAFCLFITLMIAVGLFGLGITNQVLVQANLLVIMKFFFQDTFSKAFRCLIFVFFQHTIDVGDIVYVSGAEYRVKEIGLWDTILEGLDKRLVYFSNTSLANGRICNFTRSPPQSLEFSMALHSSTTKEQLAKMEARINKFIIENPREYLPDDCYVKNIVLANSETMTFQLQYTQRSNFNVRGVMLKRHRQFTDELHVILDDLKINWAPYSLDLPKVDITPH